MPFPGAHNAFRALTGIQILHNRYNSFYRSRIEQVNAIMWQHDVLEGRHLHGDLKHLNVYVKIIVHATNMSIRIGNSRLGGYMAGGSRIPLSWKGPKLI